MPTLHHNLMSKGKDHIIEMPSATSTTGDKYSVILPTYNERRNLPVIVWLLAKTFDAK